MTKKLDLMKAARIKGLGVDEYVALHLHGDIWWYKKPDLSAPPPPPSEGPLVQQAVDFGPFGVYLSTDENAFYTIHDLMAYGVDQRGIDQGGHTLSATITGSTFYRGIAVPCALVLSAICYTANSSGGIGTNLGAVSGNPASGSGNWSTSVTRTVPPGARFVGFRLLVQPFLGFSQTVVNQGLSSGVLWVPGISGP